MEGVNSGKKMTQQVTKRFVQSICRWIMKSSLIKIWQSFILIDDFINSFNTWVLWYIDEFKIIQIWTRWEIEQFWYMLQFKEFEDIWYIFRRINDNFTKQQFQIWINIRYKGWMIQFPRFCNQIEFRIEVKTGLTT